MNEQQLIDALERQAEGVHVGAPPLDTMRKAAAVPRHRIRVAAVVLAAVTVATGGSIAVVALQSDESSETPVVEPAGAPEGTRWVGIGHAVVAVPNEWGTNVLSCGLPVADTVIFDVGYQEACGLLDLPSGVDSVAVRRWSPSNSEVRDWTARDLNGHQVLMSPATKEVSKSGSTTYQASLFVPDEHVVFEARSTSDAESIDRILAAVTILRDKVAVPSFIEANLPVVDSPGVDPQEGTTPLDRYRAELASLGLEASVMDPAGSRADIVGVRPEPGNVVEPGSSVAVQLDDE